MVPALVLAELDYWCHERLGIDAWLVFFDDVVRGAYRVEPPRRPTLSAARRCSAATRTSASASSTPPSSRSPSGCGERRIATLDRRHFAVVRPAHADAFELLPG